MSQPEYDTVGAMFDYGGSFAKALAHAASQADPENLRKLREAFPEIWEKYGEMAKAKEEAV